MTVAYMKFACFTSFVSLSHSTSFSDDDFSSFNNSIKEERLLRNETLSLKLRCHNYLVAQMFCRRFYR